MLVDGVLLAALGLLSAFGVWSADQPPRYRVALVVGACAVMAGGGLLGVLPLLAYPALIGLAALGFFSLLRDP